MWRDGIYTAFRCRICSSPRYVPVVVRRRNGDWYTTPFFKCFHCSTMFTDPVEFTRGAPSTLNQERTPGGAYGRSDDPGRS